MKPYDRLYEWTLAQIDRINKLPPPESPEHQAARRAWADQAEKELNALRKDMGLPG